MNDLQRQLIALQRKVLMADGGTDEERSAAAELEQFLLRSQLPGHYRSEALALRSEIMARAGRLDEAERDLRDAEACSETHSYARYTLQISLGRLCQQMQKIDDAVGWYRAALETCVNGSDISCGSALSALLSIRNESVLTPEERTLALRAAARSAQLFGLSPRADVPLAEQALILMERQRQPR